MENSKQVQQDNNLSIYERVRCVPVEAKKAIEAGRLKGKSDINPMWRIKKLTEVFGPVGFGWYTEVIKTWTEVDENSDVAVFVDINLFVKKDGEWSKPIYGNGGNKLISHERKYENGVPVVVPYLDDDAYKKAYTDAISVAAKALGVGADVYYEKDITKYDTAQSQNEQVQVPAQVAGTPVPEVKPTLSPSMKTWKQAIAFTASQKDSIENLSARLKAKYTITDEHLDLLLTLSGKKAANRIQS